MRKLFLAMLTAGVLGVMSSPVSAVLLHAPGTAIPLIETGIFTLLASTGILPYSFGGNTGDVEEQVWSFTGNPFGLAYLSFVYQFQPFVPDPIEQISGSDFTGFFPVDVGYNDGTTILPAPSLLGLGTIPPASALGTSLGIVAFNFFPAVSTGRSDILIVNTNATSFTTGSIGLSDGTSSETLPGFAPASPRTAPEPGTVSLFAAGLIGLVGLGFSRRRKH